MLGDPKRIERSMFAGSRYVRLDASARHQEVYVGFHLAFSKTEQGLRAYAIELDWKVPKTRPRRRIKPSDDAPPCPKCGQKLMTAKAKQCLNCGEAWHATGPTT